MGMKTWEVLKSDDSQSRKRTESGRRAPENTSLKNNKEKNVKSRDILSEDMLSPKSYLGKPKKKATITHSSTPKHLKAAETSSSHEAGKQDSEYRLPEVR